MACWTRRRHRSSASPARRTTWKGSITATASGSSSVVAVLKPVNPSIATTSTPSRQDCGALGEPGLERLLGAALDHVQQPGRAGAVADRGEVDDHGDVLVAAAGVPPDVLIDADHRRRRRTGPGRRSAPACPRPGPRRWRCSTRPPRPSATRATVRCWTTIPSSAHRSPRRDSFARGSAALVVSWRHTCPQPVHR